MTAYEKIAISLPLRAAESVRRAVREGRAPSASAYIATAIEEKSSKEDTIAWLEEMLKDAGPLTTAEQRWVDRALAASDRAAAGRRNAGGRNAPQTRKAPKARRRSR